MKTGGMTTADITTAMYFIPPVNAIMTFISGFITDFLGRKRSCVALSTVTLVGLVSFVLSASFGLSPILVTAIIILITKVNETKGVDLSTVTGAEWD